MFWFRSTGGPAARRSPAMRNAASRVRLTLLLLASSLAAAAAQEAGADASDPKVLLAQAKEAAGGDAWNRVRALRFAGALETGGLKGRVESWTDLTRARFVDRYELGPASGANGFDGKTAWEQDSSAQVRTRESADEREETADEAYRRSQAWWFPERWKATIEGGGERSESGRRFHVLRITPEGGRPFELWIDAATFLFDRVVEKAATETRTNLYSDYRTVAGLRLSFAFRSTNGNARYDQIGRVDKVEVNPEIADARFVPPPPPAPDFAIAGGRTSTTVPFTLVNNHIYVDAKLNGKGPYRLLCDTGGANVVTPAVARQLGLRSEGALEGKGAGEQSEDVGLVKIERVAIGDAVIERQLFAVFDLEKLEPAEGAAMPGLVGYEVFKRFVVRIDYGRGLLTLTLPSAFHADSRATALPFRFNGHTPEVDGEIDGTTGAFDLDTGSRASLDLTGPFVEKNGLVAKYGAKLTAVTGWGVGGPTRSLVTRTKVLKLGPLEVRDVVTGLSLQKKGALTDVYVAGNVGAGVLRRFTVTFDYGRQQVYFEPSGTPPPRDAFDRTGLWLNRGDGFFEVVDAVVGGPAHEAGIRPGDRVVAVDGAAAARLSLPELRLRLRSDPPGSRVRFRISSQGAEKDVTVVLRDLV
jgi:Aspartyl protease/PDZ domain